MKRRTFLGLAGIAAALGLPSLANASKGGAIGSGTPIEGLTNPPRPMVGSADHRELIVKVVGIGDAGGNVLEQLIREKVQGIETLHFDTDIRPLLRSNAKFRFNMGVKPGLGSCGKPKFARDIAESGSNEIRSLLDGADVVFIAAGMGGGTGTGASPIVAAIARDMGILTVAVVTQPFGWEGRRVSVAERGLVELGRNVDSLIVVSSDKLAEAFDDDQVSMLDALTAADNALCQAVRGIAEILNRSAMVSADLYDVRRVLQNMGRGALGLGSARGPKRARDAAEMVLRDPLIEDVELAEVRHALITITASPRVDMWEVKDVMATLRQCMSPHATITFGIVSNLVMEDRLLVTLIALRSKAS